MRIAKWKGDKFFRVNKVVSFAGLEGHWKVIKVEPESITVKRV
jgi:hypothetical protein